ncbi:N-acetyltransferase [Cryobacterium suzukii]|uniref:N-acetyltransferase n=1 Tax=Cryobacterium suzukii TaxID=1259198 RepID=A0A4R9AJ06_9MICO|nr:GNAT family N-acetyltransferase [Cryobacterium suzukii]TFD62622.1 N-acetyltransferase [Cryobacterium suzukii]
MDIVTDRLTLHSLTPFEAQRIVDREHEPDDVWHADYPLDDELDPLRALAESGRSESIFTLYSVRINDGDVAVGGIGFFGPPDAEGLVEIGYGLVEAVRGHGLATEALRAAIRCALQNGAVQVNADTDLENYASQRVLEKAGFTEVSRSHESVCYEFGRRRET